MGVEVADQGPPPRFQLSIPFRYVTLPVDENGDSLRHTRDGESEADHLAAKSYFPFWIPFPA